MCFGPKPPKGMIHVQHVWGTKKNFLGPPNPQVRAGGGGLKWLTVLKLRNQNYGEGRGGIFKSLLIGSSVRAELASCSLRKGTTSEGGWHLLPEGGEEEEDEVAHEEVQDPGGEVRDLGVGADHELHPRAGDRAPWHAGEMPGKQGGRPRFQNFICSKKFIFVSWNEFLQVCPQNSGGGIHTIFAFFFHLRSAKMKKICRIGEKGMLIMLEE